jgi:hydrogenase small subunit
MIMRQYSRREALKIGALLAAGFGLDSTHVAAFADGIRKIAARQTKVLWLQAMSCSGCSVSLLNTTEPEPVELLTDMISLVYHSTLSAAQGSVAMQVVDQAINDKDFLLVVEGSIPTKIDDACVFGGRPVTEILKPALRNAKAVVAAGTCAAFGGIPSAEGNPTGAVGVQEFMEQQGIEIKNRLLNCPGCPVHPGCLVGTLAYVVSKGYPRIVPKLLTPAMFYEHSVHDECPRFHYWEKEVFASKFSEEGCLFKLGCLGPLSHSTCPRRQWNGGINWCIRAAAPCIGCTSEMFGKIRDFPFYRKGEESHPVKYEESQRKEVTS